MKFYSMRYFLLMALLLLCYFTPPFLKAAELMSESGSSILPFDNTIYNDQAITNLWSILKYRIQLEPFNLVATIIFFCAILHTFFATKITKVANRLQLIHEKRMETDSSYAQPSNKLCYKAEILHILGEIEIIFALWLIPLMIAITFFFGWKEVIHYLNQVNYVESTFVVVIMAIAATKPIIQFAENCLKYIARIGSCSPAAWWFSILTLGPFLGSFITEPAAMTISAMLLGQQFYKFKPSLGLAYATLGLLFVNVSIGGTLTPFAAPPILMIANTWNWDFSFMLINFSWKVILAILISNILYFIFFKENFKNMKQQVMEETRIQEAIPNKDYPIPITITLIHILFLIWTVLNLHNIPLLLGGFMVFLACTQVTMHHQYRFAIRAPLLVGLFLAGLVTHGTLQQWWIEPTLRHLNEYSLFVGATILTAFNDNAAITFLASLVPDFANNVALQKSVVYGAVAGGGLTVIANAPNPAGQSILAHYFSEGISPLKLFLGALIPTLIVSFIFILF